MMAEAEEIRAEIADMLARMHKAGKPVAHHVFYADSHAGDALALRELRATLRLEVPA